MEREPLASEDIATSDPVVQNELRTWEDEGGAVLYEGGDEPTSEIDDEEEG